MTFIIAEVGSNWTSFEDAKDSITMAKNCGADACKFQLYTHEELYGIPGSPPTIINGVPTSEFDTMPGQLPKDWLPKLKEKADACGIEFMCSAFSPELLRAVDPYVKRHKIASAELTYRELLEAAKATGKPILLSTGGSSLTDIQMALEVLKGADVTLMYCVSAYPAKNVNLFSIERLRHELDGEYDVGYSCHTAEWYTPVAAVEYHSAAAIEKHFKLRDMDTPDSPHSLNPEQFKEMVDVIRGKADHICFPEPQERDMLQRHNRRLVATQDISPGQAFNYGKNFGCFRSLRDDSEGIHGFADQRVNGKTCKVALKAGDPITPGHIE
jgi:sialic acid synthase SpsE